MVSYKNDWIEDCQKLLRRDEDLNEIHLSLFVMYPLSLFKYYFNLTKSQNVIIKRVLKTMIQIESFNNLYSMALKNDVVRWDETVSKSYNKFYSFPSTAPLGYEILINFLLLMNNITIIPLKFPFCSNNYT